MDEGASDRRVGYRPDIQGLRAIAILLVVVCHAGIALPGGFVGVDVFFVISGFVIGAMLLRELDGTGRVSFGGFYARRARRLLPSLALLLVVGVTAGIFLLNPSWDQEIPFKTAGAASVFASNIYLYRHLGYFDAASDSTNPFLHLWSLSVEEQFYLVLPLLVAGSWWLAARRGVRAGRRGIAVAVAVVSAASFALSWAMTSGHSPVDLQAPGRFAFYSAPTRIWELGAGVLLALVAGRLARLPARAAVACGAVGALVLVITAARLDPLHPFPGLAAVPPVAGAVLLLAAGAGSAGVARTLSWSPLRWIGDRSYSWYLWHWPMIVFARLLWPGSQAAVVLAAILSLAVAAGVYAAFEDRVRRNRRIVGWRAAALAAGCIVVPLLLVFGALQGMHRGWGVAEPDDWYDLPAGRYAGCVLVNRDMASTWPEEACTTEPAGEAKGTVLVLGDDEADGVSTAVIEAATARGYRVAEWARSMCPFTGAAPAGYPACAEWQDAANDLIDRLDPDLVVIANRGTAYTTRADGPGGVGRIEDLGGGRTTSDDEAVEAWGSALQDTLGELHDRGIPAVVVGAVPDYAGDFPRPSIARPSLTPPERLRSDVDADHADLTAAEEAAVDAAGGAVFIDPVPLLCDDDVCTPFVDGRWRYSDAVRINDVGSAALQAPITAAVDRLLPAD